MSWTEWVFYVADMARQIVHFSPVFLLIRADHVWRSCVAIKENSKYLIVSAAHCPRGDDKNPMFQPTKNVAFVATYVTGKLLHLLQSEIRALPT